MISKVFTGHSFYHAVRYACKEERQAEIIAAEGVRSHDYRLMAQDFINQAQLRPTKRQACFHSVLSFYPGERPDNATLAEIGKKYLEGIGITNTQSAFVLHTDKAHLHMHVFANMVNNDGKSISDSWIALKGKKVAQQLTQEYKLTPAVRKNLSQTNIQAYSENEANKYKVYTAISANLPYCRSLEELEKRLLRQGIEMQYKYKGQTTEIQGVSFKIGTDCFKGSKVDRQFSYGNLQKAISRQHNQTKGKYHFQKEMDGYSGSSKDNNQVQKRAKQHQKEINTGQSIGVKELQKGVGKAIETLMTPEEQYRQIMPNPFLLEKRRKKKKKYLRPGW